MSPTSLSLQVFTDPGQTLEFPEWGQDFGWPEFLSDPGQVLGLAEWGQDFYIQPERSEQVT